MWPNNTTVVFCTIHQGNTKSQGMLRYRKQAHLKTSTGKFTDLYFFKLWEDSKSVEGAEKVGIWTSLNMHIQNGFHIMCHLFFPFYLLAIIRTRWIDCVISQHSCQRFWCLNIHLSVYQFIYQCSCLCRWECVQAKM